MCYFSPEPAAVLREHEHAGSPAQEDVRHEDPRAEHLPHCGQQVD